MNKIKIVSDDITKSEMFVRAQGIIILHIQLRLVN